MNVEALMTQSPKTCGPGDTLHRAAQLMWENDCGSLPVVDERRRPIGMITDRDVCMCAFTQGLPLAALRVETAMSPTVVSCSPRDSLASAERRMREHRIHRLPVMDAAGEVVGVLSLNDIAREAELGRISSNGRPPVTDQEVAATLGAICSRLVALPVVRASV